MITIQRGDTGIDFVVTIKDEQTKAIIDLSTATSITFIFRKPDKTTYSVSGSLYTDGKDGVVHYVSQSTDLDMAGIWRFQCSYQLSGYAKYTGWTSFQVMSNLSDI